MSSSRAVPRIPRPTSRPLRGLVAALLALLCLAPACSSDDSLPLIPATRLCEPGLTRQCVGDGACAGGQVCDANGAAWSPCRCGGSSGTGGAASSGGSGGKGGGGGTKAGGAGAGSVGGKGGSGGGNAGAGSGKGGTGGGASGSNAGEGGSAGSAGDGGGEGGSDAGGEGGTASGTSGATAGEGGSAGAAGASEGGNAGAAGAGGSETAGASGSAGSVGCEPQRGDCDGDATNGCEVDLASDAAHCGACATSCGAEACTNGQCACSATAITAIPLPSDLFLMLDKSSSMDTAITGGSGTRWSNAVSGLGVFIDGVQAADRTGMGLGLFPSSSCDPTLFAKAIVGIADLPANAGPLKAKLTSTQPNGGDTPTKPALEGALLQAKQRLVDFPARSVVVVLLTDGEPNECFEGFPTFPPKDVVGEIVEVAKGGAQAGIATYVVGVFGSNSTGTAKNAVQKWAVAGGTKDAFILDSTATLAANVASAFGSIRASAGVCAYEVPAAVAAAPSKASLTLQAATGNVTLSRVADAAACQSGDWYYDNAAAPTKLTLCPKMCEATRATVGAKIAITPSCAP